MSASPHVVVIGLGITGSAIAAALSRRGVSVTAVDQFQMLHDNGSSHGDTRIFRRIPHEGESYVEMAAISWRGWQEWSAASEEKLFVMCGGIDAGPCDSEMVWKTERLCRKYDQVHEVLTSAALATRYAYFDLPPGWNAVYQPSSGFVRPDATIRFLHAAAMAAGARLIHEERIIRITSGSTSIRVTTERRQLTCDMLFVAAGAWCPKLFPELSLPLISERRVTAWYEPCSPERLADGRMPVFCFDQDGGWYGMPTPDGLLKVGNDKHFNQHVDPDVKTTAPDEADASKIGACLQRYLRGFRTDPVAMKPCIYTIAADHNFIIDHHPQHPNIFLFSCCSGHGFKYAPAYGVIAADLMAMRTELPMTQSSLDVQPFRLKRFNS